MYVSDVSESAPHHDEVSYEPRPEGVREGGARAGSRAGSEPAHARAAQEQRSRGRYCIVLYYIVLYYIVCMYTSVRF